MPDLQGPLVKVCEPDSWARQGECISQVMVDFAMLGSWIRSYSEFHLTSLEALWGWGVEGKGCNTS